MSAANHTPIMSTEDLQFKDGAPRVHDLRLAKALGFAQPRDIRKLISRHMDALNEFGQVCGTVPQTSKQGGRPGQEYWLNQNQAMHIIANSGAEQADQIKTELAELFSFIECFFGSGTSDEDDA